MPHFEKSASAFLHELLNANAPSSFEDAAGDAWEQYTGAFATTARDRVGNRTARLGSGSTVIQVAGHLDEIGVIVSKIDDDGFLRIQPIGGWDPSVLVGQRIRILSDDGVVTGCIARPAPHQMQADQKGKVTPIKDLWADIGAADGDAARERVRVGDPAVIDADPVELPGERLMARALDNRLGCFIAAEILRELADDKLDAEVVGAVTVHEETGGAGARAVTHGINPDLAFVFDATPSTDGAGVQSPHKLAIGEGPVISRGSQTTASLVEDVIRVADGQEIPYQLRGLGIRTGTDADQVFRVRGGVPIALVSVPTRNLHSPVELCDLADVRSTIDLVVAWIREHHSA